MNPTDQYYVMRGGDAEGPFTVSQMRNMWSSGNINLSNQYCHPGGDEWLPIEDIVYLMELKGESPKLKAATRYPMDQIAKKARSTYILLALFFGMFGIHNFYIMRTGCGLTQLLATLSCGLLMAFTPYMVFALVFVAVWVLIEAVVITTDADGRPLV